MKKFVPPMRKPDAAAPGAKSVQPAVAQPVQQQQQQQEPAAVPGGAQAAAAKPSSTFMPPMRSAGLPKKGAPAAGQRNVGSAAPAAGQAGPGPSSASAQCYSVTYCNRKELGKKRKNRAYLDGILRVLGDSCLLYDDAGAQTGKGTVKGLGDLPEGATVMVREAPHPPNTHVPWQSRKRSPGAM